MKTRVSAVFLSAVLFFVNYCSIGFSDDEERGSKIAEQQTVPLKQIHLQGEWGTRYIAATCNLLTRTDRYSLDSFVASASGKPGALWWDWPGDQVGRWFSVLSVAEGLGWAEAAKQRQAVADVVLPCQTPEGYFGAPNSLDSDDIRIPSGNAFALRGLVDAYADTHDMRYLEAARKLARYFEKIAPRWETKSNGRLHEFYGHCIDGLVALYEQGGDRWALEFAERLAKHYGRAAHTHHALSLCRGLVDLARATGNKEYLASVEDYLVWCRENRTVSGGLPESMPTMPENPQDEGCGLADWIVVNLMMFQATNEDRYLEDAEHTLINYFFMNQFHTGGFGHRLFTQAVVGGKQWQGWDGQFGSENPGCCSLWGQWALGEAAKYIVTEKNDTVSVNLYPEAEINLPSRGIRLEIASDFPRMEEARIRVVSEKPQTFTLALHNPKWSSISADCDGVNMGTTGHTLSITRAWQGSQTIRIRFGGGLRAVEWPASKPQGTAVFDGPLCLGLSGAKADVNLAWTLLTDAAGKLILDENKRPQVVDPTGNERRSLAPIGSDWLSPEVKNPHSWRILFETKQDRKVDE